MAARTMPQGTAGDPDGESVSGGGRAFDIALKLQRKLGDHWSLAGAYRLLDGGADNEALYTFARFDYAVLSLQYRW